MNFFERFLAQSLLAAVCGLIHLDEPLFGGAENHRIVAAPAMRVAVRIGIIGQESASIGEKLYDNGIRRKHILALIFGQAFEIYTLIVNRRVGFQAVLLPSKKVVSAMAGRGMHDSCSLIEFHIIGEHSRHNSVEKWMLEAQTSFIHQILA